MKIFIIFAKYNRNYTQVQEEGNFSHDYNESKGPCSVAGYKHQHQELLICSVVTSNNPFEEK